MFGENVKMRVNDIKNNSVPDTKAKNSLFNSIGKIN